MIPAHDDHYIRELKALAREGTRKARCPFCHHSHAKHNKGATDLVITKDFERILFFCHRCNEKGRIDLQSNIIRMETPPPRREEKREERDPGGLQPLTQDHFTWLAGRGISEDTAKAYSLFASNKGSGDLAIGFPYYSLKGKINSVKTRALHEKKFSCWQAPISFFGVEKLTLGDDLFIVEGEMDVLALAEAGIRAISVPNGAPAKISAEGRVTPEEDTKFRFLWNSKEYIEKAKRVILATDTDAPGNALAEEIARRVGKAKCYRVNWESGKDANEVLLLSGKEGLLAEAEKTTPWPVEGLFDADHFRGNVTDLFDKGVGRGATVGYGAVDEIYSVVEGQFTVVTGNPSSGKSEFIDQMMVNLASTLQWKFAICSFENEPRLHIAKLISKKLKKPFFERFPHTRMARKEMEAGHDWVNNHFVFLHQENGDLSDLDSPLDRIRAAVLRHGVRGVVIDPYNYIHRPRDMSETEWITTMLTRIKVFAASHGVHIWFVAHPQKMQRNAEGRYPVPGGYDISGSAAWFAKADCGMTIHREKDDPFLVQVHLWKVRFQWVGKQGEARIRYDPASESYYETEQAEAEEASEFI